MCCSSLPDPRLYPWFSAIWFWCAPVPFFFFICFCLWFVELCVSVKLQFSSGLKYFHPLILQNFVLSLFTFEDSNPPVCVKLPEVLSPLSNALAFNPTPAPVFYSFCTVYGTQLWYLETVWLSGETLLAPRVPCTAPLCQFSTYDLCLLCPPWI